MGLFSLKNKALLIFLAALGLAWSAPAFSASKDAPPKELVQDLRSSDPAKQRQAKQALRLYNYKQIARAIEGFAKDKSPDVRILMAQTLGEIGGFESAERLKKLYAKDKSAAVRRAAAFQLAGLLPDETQAFEFFKLVAWKDDDQEIRSLALNQLSLLSGVPFLKSDLARAFHRVLKKDDSSHNRVLAALALKELGKDSDDISATVLDALRSRSVDLRRRAALLAGSIRSDAAVSSMTFSVRDPDAEVRANLCRSLGQSPRPEVLPLLKALWKDPDMAVRRGAFNALANYAPKDVGLAVFVAALEDSDAGVRALAVQQMEKLGDGSALPALQKAAESDADGTVRFLSKKAISVLRGGR